MCWGKYIRKNECSQISALSAGSAALTLSVLIGSVVVVDKNSSPISLAGASRASLRFLSARQAKTPMDREPDHKGADEKCDFHAWFFAVDLRFDAS